MVLSELDRLDDGSPPSTDYSSSETSVPEHSFNFNPANSPPAIVSLKPYTGLLLPESDLRQILDKLSTATTDLLRRPATQDEAEAVTQYTSEIEYERRAGLVVGTGAGVGAFLASRGTAAFPIPGIQKLMGDGQRFGPLLQGRNAMVMWQMTRLSLWLFTGMVGGTVASATWATVTLTPRYFRDQRLSAVLAEMKKRANEKSIMVENRRKEAQALRGQTPGPMAGETAEMARQRMRATGAWNSGERKQRSSGEDDMSPTGGAFSQEYVETGAGNEMLSDAEVTRQYASSSMQTSSESVPTPQGTSARTGSAQASSPASRSTTPTSPSTQKSSEVQASGSGSGSAWDRLRQKALSGSGQPQPSSTTSTSASRGSDAVNEYSFTSGENDGQAQARAQAQREFDARLEQEREGKNFDERGAGGSSGGRRW